MTQSRRDELGSDSRTGNNREDYIVDRDILMESWNNWKKKQENIYR
jgi:hypothetical protein